MRPHDQLRARQTDQLLITLNKAYKHHSQQDMPETIFNLLFNRSPATEQDKKSDDGHARENKDEIHRLLWAIIRNKRKAPNCDKPWTPGSVQYPALIVQLLRVRFPSSEPDVLLPNCISLSIEDFVEHTSSWNLRHVVKLDKIRWLDANKISHLHGRRSTDFLGCLEHRSVDEDASRRARLQNEKIFCRSASRDS